MQAVGRSSTGPVASPKLRGPRSSVLRRAGTSVSFEVGAADGLPAVGGMSASSAASGSAGQTSERRGSADSSASAPGVEAEIVPVAEDVGCGLTPASLKHLRRQNAKLTEDKDRLSVEVSAVSEKLRDEQSRVVGLQSSLVEAEARNLGLQEEVEAGLGREEEQASRISELSVAKAKVEETLMLREAEVETLKRSLEEQRELTRQVCRAADRQGSRMAAADSGDREAREALEKQNGELRKQLAALSASASCDNDLERLRSENEALRKDLTALKNSMAEVAGAAEQAMLLSAAQMDKVNKIRNGALADAINRKIELHVSVPKVTLTYNNSPALAVGLGTFLSQDRIRSFVDREVFPHFEPLWVRVDDLDKAPDGTSKKAYCTRMLEMLTQSIKGFVMKAQSSDSGPGEDLPQLSSSDGATAPTAAGAQSPLGMSGPLRAKSRTSTLASGGVSEMAEDDRERLLALIRSGDDRGLDSKLRQMLGKS